MLRAAIPVIRVSSAAAAERFYCGMLGFEMLSANRANDALPDPCYMAVRRDGVVLHLSSFPGDGAAGVAVFVLVDDVDALHAELLARGVPIDLPPTDQTWGNREMYVKDVDRNCLRFVHGRRSAVP